MNRRRNRNSARGLIFRVWRYFVPAAAKAPSIDYAVHPDTSGLPRVLLLASNPVDFDTRVKKTTASLRANGFAVGILGTAKAGTVHAYLDPGLSRAPYDMAFFRFFYRRGYRKLRLLDKQIKLTRGELSAVMGQSALLAGHDHLLTGLSDRRSLLRKILFIVRQRILLRYVVAAPAKAARLQRRIKQLALRRSVVKGELKKQIAATSERYKKLAPAGHHLDFFYSFRNHIAGFSPDIIHANDLLTLPAALRYRQRIDKRVRVVYDAHELEMHRNRSYNFRRILVDQLVEWYFIRKADAVITVSEGIADELAKSYGISRPTVVLNSPSAIASRTSESLRDRLGLGLDAKITTYTGVVTEGRGIDTLVKSLSFLPGGHHIAILGPRREDRDAPLMRLADKLGVSERLHLIDPVAPEEVASVLAGADITINPSIRVCLSYDLALPNKLFDGVSAQVPNLVPTDLSEMSKFVRETRTGASHDLNSPETIAEGVLRILALKEAGFFNDTDWVGVAGRYSWEAQTEKLVSVYRGLVG